MGSSAFSLSFSSLSDFHVQGPIKTPNRSHSRDAVQRPTLWYPRTAQHHPNADNIRSFVQKKWNVKNSSTPGHARSDSGGFIFMIQIQLSLSGLLEKPMIARDLICWLVIGFQTKGYLYWKRARSLYWWCYHNWMYLLQVHPLDRQRWCLHTVCFAVSNDCIS